ncbi:DUF4055 domain-containing protein [Rhodobium gokarnense]|uniref:DUF4055 domain-containing protein n=1 Tax=Rhodobium gokarnense TaxID=364296 RepID=A0ABT3HH27_9HYPH|nr:DUF4055 domain-containing protein [Rhodobium gokarnense]MCW2309708.1 hypothetical protein [Rhodobium gokarnense]
MTEDFDITSHHPSYDAYAPDWERMRDAVEGERCIKDKGKAYLPMKSGMVAMTDLQARDRAYEAYKARAEFPEIVGPTVRGALGLIHSKESTIELPSGLKSLEEKATRDGLTLQTLHQRVTAELLRLGRYGLMPGVTDAGEFYIAGYTAESAINWDAPTGTLEYLVLDESAEERDVVTNKWSKVCRYLECQRTAEAGFETRKWIEKGSAVDGKKKFEVEADWSQAGTRRRDRLPFLPFTFIDTMDLTPEPDDIPLYGLANLAFRAYRLDADYMTAMHWTSEPQPWISGCSRDNAPTAIGASNLWVFEDTGAKADFLEFTGPGVEAQRKAITDTLERAIMFGAQLFADNKRTAESGEALRLRLGSQTSTLKMVSVQSAAGLERCLKDAALWAGANPDEVHVEPNLDFVDHELSPQEILAIVSAWQSGAYSKVTLFENLQRGGVIDPGRTLEEEQQLIDDEGPALGGVTAPPEPTRTNAEEDAA